MSTRRTLLFLAMSSALAMIACPSLDGFSVHGDGGSGDAPTCGDVQGDSNNCGACGHGCLGGQCVSGVCQPIAVVSGLAHAASLSVSDTYIAWMANGGGTGSSYVFFCTLQDCGKTLKQVDQSISPARGVGLTASNLFWAYDPLGVSSTQGRAMGCNPASCVVPKQYAPATSGDPFVAVDVRPGTENMFFLRSDGVGAIEGYDASGKRSFYGAPIGAPKQLDVYVIAGLETVYYANTSGEIYFAPLGGAITSNSLRGAGPLGVFAADDKRLVWSTGTSPDALESCDVHGCQGAPTSVATGLVSTITSLTSDGARIYMSDAGGRILSCDPTRCNDSIVILAQGQPSPIAVTKKLAPPAVYWLDVGAGATNGAIMRVAE